MAWQIVIISKGNECKKVGRGSQLSCMAADTFEKKEEEEKEGEEEEEVLGLSCT